MNSEFDIRYERSARARGISVRVIAGGGVIVRYPFFSSQKTAEHFVMQKADWIRRSVEKRRDMIALPKASNRHFAAHKEEARKLILERLAHFNLHYNLQWKGVRIGRQKSRWGSCSKRGMLSFNYALLFLSPELRDYVVIHELCHLKEFNHSKRFWDLVAEKAPGWKESRRQLRKHAAG